MKPMSVSARGFPGGQPGGSVPTQKSTATRGIFRGRVRSVVLSALLIIIGAQLLLSALNLDLQSIPREPINGGPIRSQAASDARTTPQADSPGA